jgi:hypothetical protein
MLRAGVALAVGALLMLAGQSSADSSIQSTPDSFTLYANTIVHGLPVADNDTSQGAADVEICRFDPDLNGVEYGTAKLTDYSIELHANPFFHGTANETYALCNTTVVGPVTTVTLNIKRLYEVRSTRVNRTHVSLANRNDHSVICHVGDRQWHSVAAKSSKTFKSIKGNSRDRAWVCVLRQKLGNAVAGQNGGLH